MLFMSIALNQLYNEKIVEITQNSIKSIEINEPNKYFFNYASVCSITATIFLMFNEER
jgi:hypothetical protein